jgi:histone acetyltransferase (RNA polymerase elongator complex component)
MKKHSNIPFFIPHSGCPNNCVFCSQVKITGKSRLEPSLDKELRSLQQTVEESLNTLPAGCESQLAFFGGSFTGIERGRMVALLEAGYKYVKSGRLTGIRFSTRPDYIDVETLEILKKYGVTDIELGIQSMSDKVLTASARGHKAEVSYRSAELIIQHGFQFVGQMMVGLPESTVEDEVNTADAIIKMGAANARIYPTVVFAETILYDMVKSGAYKPITDNEAVERSALCLDRFVQAGVEVLKIGLHSSESLSEAEYGANHPSIGELVKARLYYKRITEMLDKMDCNGKSIVIYIKNGEQSKLTGYGGKLLEELKAKYGITHIKVKTAETQLYQPIIKFEEEKQCGLNQ